MTTSTFPTKTTLLFVAILFSGCFQTIAIRTMAGIMDYGFEAFNEESDTELAREALGANLKLIEALIKGDPENEKLLLFAAQGYNAYSLAFVEDDSLERARSLYLRARDFALRILGQKDGFRSGMNGDFETFSKSVGSLSREDVPAAFWAAFAWGSYVNITRTDPDALIDLPKVEALMGFVRTNDSTYYHGGALLFFGSIEGSLPPALGGKPEKARDYFERCLAVNKGKFLMTQVFYAKTYAVQVQDQELYESLLKKVIEAPSDILPAATFPNAVAKQKAQRLLANTNEYF
ncbi:MAG: hypothetical protein HYY49_00040 [Ignavibacteriales bacterium]|nr:hypothetical protein [Ignavibacteriales bacterium]